MDTDIRGISMLPARVLLSLVMLAVLFIGFGSAAETPAAIPEKTNTARLYLFWGRGCPHCEKELAFLRTLRAKYPSLEIRDYEVWYDRQNAILFSQAMRSAGTQAAGVPATVVGKKLFVGFTEQTAKSIEEAVALCINRGCTDALQAMISPEAQPPREEPGKTPLPLIGEVDPSTVSLPLFTLVIGALDSFNPCAFFVLLFLLSMLIHIRSRKKMLFIGGVFVFFSGFVYFLFMAAWLNIFMVLGKLTAITAAAGAIAVIVAALNIKDFFFFRKGVSLVMSSGSKARLFHRMRGLLNSSSVPTLLAGTVVLAVTANAYELLCTAGFPMVYTRALTLHHLTTLQYYLYLVLYNVVYVVPLGVIVVVITATLGARKLTEWQGRQLKLVSGLMMFFLGLILLINPAYLNNAAASVVLLGVVIVVSGITILITRRLKPEIAAD